MTDRSHTSWNGARLASLGRLFASSAESVVEFDALGVPRARPFYTLFARFAMLAGRPRYAARV